MESSAPVGRVLSGLPRSVALDDRAFRFRHRRLLSVLVVHTVLTAGWLLAAGPWGPTPVALLAVAASATAAGFLPGRKLPAAAVAAGLMACASEVAVLGGGRPELLAYPYVLVAALSLYQDWTPLLAAVGSLAGQAVGAGLAAPGSLAARMAGRGEGAGWLVLHVLFALAEGLSLAVGWRLADQAVRNERRALSEQAHLTEDLRRAQEIEALGRLAAGIAHEINTPMQFLSDNLAYLDQAWSEMAALLDLSTEAPQRLRQGDDPGRLAGEFEEAIERADLEFAHAEIPGALSQSQEGVKRVAGIVKAMKELGHPDHDEPEPADLDHLVTNTLTVARNETKYVADVETELGGVPTIDCYPGALSQVLLNLMINSAYAVRQVFDRTGERGRIVVRTWSEEGTVCLSVSDTGSGIPAEILPNIFKPFYTTKPVGQGTGQGLALAWKTVVDRHRGRIDVETGPAGTTFTIRIPSAAAGPGPEGAAGERATAGVAP